MCGSPWCADCMLQENRSGAGIVDVSASLASPHDPGRVMRADLSTRDLQSCGTHVSGIGLPCCTNTMCTLENIKVEPVKWRFTGNAVVNRSEVANDGLGHANALALSLTYDLPRGGFCAERRARSFEAMMTFCSKKTSKFTPSEKKSRFFVVNFSATVGASGMERGLCPGLALTLSTVENQHEKTHTP